MRCLNRQPDQHREAIAQSVCAGLDGNRPLPARHFERLDNRILIGKQGDIAEDRVALQAGPVPAADGEFIAVRVRLFADGREQAIRVDDVDSKPQCSPSIDSDTR